MKFKLNFKKFILIIAIVCIAYLNGFFINPLLISTKEYEPYKGNIKGNVNTEVLLDANEDFEVGANMYGYAVYKNPVKAFATLRSEYKDGIKLIQKEFHLLPLTQLNYDSYKTYGWQVTTGSKEEQQQASFVSGFFDIYENSYKFNH